MPDPSIRVVIIDDHPIVRAGMRSVLCANPDITVVAEGSSGDQAISLTANHQPDVLVLDVNLPGLSGLEVTRQLHRQPVHPAILILTVQNDSQTIFSLLEGGATGYVLKDEALETLAPAVRAAARGEAWFSPAVAEKVLRRALHPASAAHTPLSDLTAREVEVLGLLAQGLDNSAIAARLVLTTRTVQNHVSTIYSKLGVASRTEAALLALQNGLAKLSPAAQPGDEP